MAADFSKFDASFAQLKADVESFKQAQQAADQAAVDERQVQVDALDAEVKQS